MFFNALSFLTLAAGLASAHMEMISPIPWTGQGTQDRNFDLTAPMNAQRFPCNVPNFDTYASGPGAAPIATWAAGSTQKFVIGGGAPHNGGSCQAVISEDKGKTWKVIENFIGGCPTPGKEFPFTVPAATKSGPVIFGWSWLNKSGNREMYMNCATITITGGGSGLSGLPGMFIANVEGVTTCKTKEGIDPTFIPGDCVEGTAMYGSVGGGASAGGSPPTGGAAPVQPPTGNEGTNNGEKPPAVAPPPSNATATPPAYVAAPAPPVAAPAPPVAAPAPVPAPAAPPKFDDGLWNPTKYDKPFVPQATRLAKRMHHSGMKRRHVVGGLSN